MNQKSKALKKKVGRSHKTRTIFPEKLRRWELLIVFWAIVCDLNSWRHQFVMDDLARILGNPLVKSLRHIPDIFISPYSILHGMPSSLYRPLTTLSFALNYSIGGTNPDAYHLVNRLMHVLICLGIYGALRRLVSNPTVAVISALLFAVHPIQTEAITYISGRSDALAMAFFIFGWLFFIRLRTSDSSQTLKNYRLSILFYFFALLSKESAIVWLGVVLLTELVFFSKNQFPSFFSKRREDFLKIYAGYVGITLVYLAMRFAVLKGASKVAVTFLDNPLAHVSAPVRVLTALKILFQSVGLLLWPIKLSADYSYNQIPLISHWNNLGGFVVLALSGAMILLLAWTYRRAPEIFFGLGFFLITYSIVGNLLLPIGTIRADRLLYMPSLGIFFLAGIALAGAEAHMTQTRLRKALAVAVSVILVLLSARTILRNRDWSDEFTLYFQTVRTAPQSAKAQNDLGAQYFARNDFEKAREHYRIAESIKPDYPDLLNNLGTLFSRESKNEEALTYLRRAVFLSPENPEIRNNLGLTLRAQGNLAEAIAQYDLVIQQYPANADAHFNKANALYAQGKINEAITEYSRTLEIDPDYTTARKNLNLLLQKSDPTSQQPGRVLNY